MSCESGGSLGAFVCAVNAPSLRLQRDYKKLLIAFWKVGWFTSSSIRNCFVEKREAAMEMFGLQADFDSQHWPSHPMVRFLTDTVPDKMQAVKHRPLCRKLSSLSQLWQSASLAAELCRHGLRTRDLRLRVYQLQGL